MPKQTHITEAVLSADSSDKSIIHVATIATKTMKHIFFVHSHICYAVSLGVIEHERLPWNDVIFITDRSYKIPDKSKSAATAPDERWFSIERNIITGWRNIRKIENHINMICPENFEYYCPHTLSPFHNFMADHPKCEAIHVIEEGTASYLTIDQINNIFSPHQLNWKKTLWSRLFYSGRFHTHYFYRNDISKAYCTHESAFPDISHKITLALDLSRAFKNDLTAGLKIVLALDSTVETKCATPEAYINGLTGMVEHIRNNKTAVEAIQVKLHPYQYVNREFADQLLAMLRVYLGPIRVIELSPDTAIEAMKPSPGARLYLGISSLSIYATRNGIPCYSFAQRIAKDDSKYCERLAQQPKVFFDSVSFI